MHQVPALPGLPADTAVRLGWAELPGWLRSAVTDRLGASVVGAVSQGGGFTPGVAARLALADGSRVFVKALAAGAELARDYRSEARLSALLPSAAPAPRLRFSIDAGGWVLLVFDDVDGRHPDLVNPADLASVLVAVERMGIAFTPSPVAGAPIIEERLGPLLNGWRQFAEQGPPVDLESWSVRHLARLAELESGWVAATWGNTLLHADLRPDNILLAPGGDVVFVDWAWSCLGAVWVDVVFLLPAAIAVGLDAEEIVRAHPTTRTVDPAVVDAFVCALAGHYAFGCRQPPPSWSPYMRAFEARSARLCRLWLVQRTGWP